MTIAMGSDGTDVRGFDEGAGPVILVLAPGADDGSSWGEVARRLSSRFRVIRMHRRQYRLDLDNPTGFPLSAEVDDAIAVIQQVGLPVLVVGHSSGGVVALELLTRQTVTGAVLYEPPVRIPGMEWDEPLARASAAIAASKPGRAMAIFATDIVGAPRWLAAVGGALVVAVRRFREFAPRQIFDAKAIYELGVRLDAYAKVTTPTALLSGARSPKHLGERIDVLASTMPAAEKVVLARQGHTAQLRAPSELATMIAAYYDRLLAAQ